MKVSLFHIQKGLPILFQMTTVIRGRARPTAPQPSVAPPSTQPETDLSKWVQIRAMKMIRSQTFSYELSQGIVKEDEIQTYGDLKTDVIEEMIRHTLAQIELRKDEPGFTEALNQAISTRDYDFDFDTWDSNFSEQLKTFQDYEVVFFKNRTTAFTLPKPCPNCGQKKLIAEGSVFTRAADEAASQFATCKNCSSRFRLQSVL
jgi:DNA-directed RNA polymerase subunit M/transcription elongation factor TFIIS